jgi:Ser/Thr protein kinase RdoA (MazF antagonist)
MLSAVLQNYDINTNKCVVQPFGSGLINSTWKIESGKAEYILQKINHAVFKQPESIAENIRLLANYLAKNYPGYLFVAPVKTKNNQEMVFIEDEGYFRLFPFVKNSHTIDVVTNPAQAFEAAKQFAAFTKCLVGFDTADLKITLPDFHNLTLRYRQFENALLNGNLQRIQQTAEEIKLLKKYKNIVDEFENIKLDRDFKIRVTHHDTKISNVLFDKNDKGLCVIDLDTIMPGYFISDVGDMLRTYLSPAGEEEKDFSKIEIRQEYLDAIVTGYLSEMNSELTEKEKQSFIYAGKFMIYMQALRFLTDYLNNDVYYGSKYEGHNLVRAKNQLVLLQLLADKEGFVKL